MQTSPGWYPDPDPGPDPAGPAPVRTLRYWDGKAWTDRRRPQPVLTSLELSGLAGPAAKRESRAIERPVRTAELPGPAPAPVRGAEVGASTQEAAVRAAPSTADRGGGDPPAPPPPPSGGGDGGGGDRDPESPGPPTRARRKWWVLVVVALLGALAVGLAGQAVKPASPGPRVLTDLHFVQLANAECRAMANLRPQDSGPLGRAESPAQTAGKIDASATGLDDLANRIGALPAAEPDKPHIGTWLDGWHGFASVGHTYADYLRRYGANQKNAPEMLQRGAQLAKVADKFARANGLANCTFAVVPLMDPSTM